MKNEIEEYRKVLCENCMLKETCNKDLIKIKMILDRKTIRCDKYIYNKSRKVDE